MTIKQQESKYFDNYNKVLKSQPWYKRLNLYIKVRWWFFVCNTRFLWDKSYSGYLFKKRDETN